nr:hypothetical protein [Corynebacterium sp. UBA5992]
MTRRGNWLGAWGRHAGQATVEQFLTQCDDRKPARRVSLERQLDPRGTLRVEFDPAYLVAQLVALAHFEVADGRPARSAAGDRFLGHAFGHFGDEVAP